MDPYVADPHWGGYIVWYFYLGGIAAGAYAVAAMAAIFGGEADRRATRPAHYIAFPLIAVCGAVLTVDLNRPERFWHMLIQSETFRPMFKWWSPMSRPSPPSPPSEFARTHPPDRPSPTAPHVRCARTGRW